MGPVKMRPVRPAVFGGILRHRRNTANCDREGGNKGERRYGPRNDIPGPVPETRIEGVT